MDNVKAATKRGHWAKASDLVWVFRASEESSDRRPAARRRRALGWWCQGGASPWCKQAGMLAFGVAVAAAPTQSPASPWDDAVLVLCQPVSSDAYPSNDLGRCNCSIQNVETLISQEAVTELLQALRRVGAASAAEVATFAQQRDAACRLSVPELATAAPGT